MLLRVFPFPVECCISFCACQWSAKAKILKFLSHTLHTMKNNIPANKSDSTLHFSCTFLILLKKSNYDNFVMYLSMLLDNDVIYQYPQYCVADISQLQNQSN